LETEFFIFSFKKKYIYKYILGGLIFV